MRVCSAVATRWWYFWSTSNQTTRFFCCFFLCKRRGAAASIPTIWVCIDWSVRKWHAWCPCIYSRLYGSGDPVQAVCENKSPLNHYRKLHNVVLRQSPMNIIVSSWHTIKYRLWIEVNRVLKAIHHFDDENLQFLSRMTDGHIVGLEVRPNVRIRRAKKDKLCLRRVELQIVHKDPSFLPNRIIIQRVPL